MKTTEEKTATLYEGTIYTMIGKTKLCYGMNLDFYELEFKDLKDLSLYDKQTVRYKGDWFIVESKAELFRSEEKRDKYPKNWIKYPYKQPKPILDN